MCLICIEFQKGRMSSQEFKRALDELIVFSRPEDLAHYEELKDLQSSGNDRELLRYTKEHASLVAEHNKPKRTLR